MHLKVWVHCPTCSSWAKGVTPRRGCRGAPSNEALPYTAWTLIYSCMPFLWSGVHRTKMPKYQLVFAFIIIIIILLVVVVVNIILFHVAVNFAVDLEKDRSSRA